MKSLKYSLIISLFSCIYAIPVLAFPDSNLSDRLSGKILLDVDNRGAAWYVYPGDFHRYSLGTPADAFSIMRNLSLGVSNSDFLIISSTTPNWTKGLILLKPEDLGRAYYVNPADNSMNYLNNPADAFGLMREFSLGITTDDLKTIPIGKINTDNAGKQTGREWQYLGWWGRVNKNRAAVKTEPQSDSSSKGQLYYGNTVKVIGLERAGGRTWYKIDGGQYPGGYLDSQVVSPMPQPITAKNITVPVEVAPDDHWTDVNITKKVLTLYKNDQVVMATYVSIGNIKSPTILGNYSVWYKTEKTRMRGAPPLATHVYDLVDVPWVMYYQGSYSIHGTYWHDDFGTERSAGCTNITQGDAKHIFDITKPDMDGSRALFSSADNLGMVVVNHN